MFLGSLINLRAMRCAVFSVQSDRIHHKGTIDTFMLFLVVYIDSQRGLGISYTTGVEKL